MDEVQAVAREEVVSAGARAAGEEGRSAGASAEESEPGAANTADAVEAVANAGTLDEVRLARLREVLVAAHPEAVPELIAGADFDSLLGSIEGARAAFARVREETARVAAGIVPRGGGTREVDPAVFAGLSPEGKIAQGLRAKYD